MNDYESLSKQETIAAMQDALAALSNAWAVGGEGLPSVGRVQLDTTPFWMIHAQEALEVMMLRRYEADTGRSARELLQQFGELLVERAAES